METLLNFRAAVNPFVKTQKQAAMLWLLEHLEQNKSKSNFIQTFKIWV